MHQPPFVYPLARAGQAFPGCQDGMFIHSPSHVPSTELPHFTQKMTSSPDAHLCPSRNFHHNLPSVQFRHSVVSDSLQPHESQHARPPCLSPTPGAYSKVMSIELVMPSNHLVLCRPLLLLPPIPPSIRVFSDESALCMKWPKHSSFSFSISPSNEYSGLISFRMDWLDLLAVQGTLKSLLQHHSSKVLIFRCSAFFTVQLSHPNMITGKTIALTRWTFVGKVMSLFFNMLSKLVITFLPRSVF